ncbi:MAG TPA: FKBP-type peptidyl-prolyl cis-trans isomerase [Oceanospirillaceae bacterium]|nr:FKBP-type peptidyl-prolyl cis-trans isomerase [Oceanospirillaceae bacterium]
MITNDSQVTLHFALRTEQGEEIDSTFAGQPAKLNIGDGNLLPDFEACLIGLQVGAKETFTMTPEKAFGQRNDGNIQAMKRHQFGADQVLEVGLVFSFADAANGELPGVVKSIEGDEVQVDFNHPLAGMTLNFEVEIVAID